MKKVLLYVLLFLAPVITFAQIAVMDFDGTTPEWSFTNDIAFFDNNADGFYGIHDANGDATDGTPTDTGDGNPASVANINYAPIAGDFLFVHDLDDEGDNGTTGDASLTFSAIDISGFVNVVITFDYDVFEFDNGDDLTYNVFHDGVDQGTVLLVDGASNLSVEGTESISVPDNVNSVSIVIAFDQNGTGDQGALDNITIDGDVALPVSLSSFTAKPMDKNTISLDWSTASEENNEYFSIEHSTDGQEFKAIDQVQGALNSNEVKYYNYEHKGASKGMNYYRLRQVDTDGTFSFSSIEVVSLNAEIGLQVRPTLADQSIVIAVDEAFDNKATIEVYNVLGSLVVSETLAGGTSQTTLNISNLENGHYFIKLTNGTASQTTRFVKR